MTRRAYALRDDSSRSRGKSARARRATEHLGKTTREPVRGIGCFTNGYVPRMESGSTKSAPNISPILRGCYADPIEVALEMHSVELPKSIPDPGLFTSEHRYYNPRDPGAWPKLIAVTTVCRKHRLRTFIHQPGESLSVFGGIF